MARPHVDAATRKVPCAVSLTAAQRATFIHLGGSKWLQGILDGRSEKVMTSKERVLLKFPHAVCRAYQGDDGRAVYAVHMTPTGAMANSKDTLITGGWATSNQAWERAAVAVHTTPETK